MKADDYWVVVSKLPKITQAPSTKRAGSVAPRGSGLFLLAALSLGMTVVACDKRDDGDGDGGGINQVDTLGPAESEGTLETGTGADGTGGNDIELPPDTGGETGGNSGEACSSSELDLKPQPTNLMLVIDRSRSMVANTWDHDGNPDSDEVTRWRSLHGVVDQVTGKFDGSIDFGAQIYPGQSDKTGMEGSCAVSAMPEVSIQSGAREKILAAIPAAGANDSEVKGATPTYAAYVSALAQLKAAEADAQAKSSEERMPPAIVLITDGGANCVEIKDDNTDLAHCAAETTKPSEDLGSAEQVKCLKAWYDRYDDRIETAVQGAATDDNIKTYVIGIGIEDKETLWPTVNAHQALNALATKGGTAREAETKYFSANNQGSLLSALNEIAASVASCSVALDEPIPPRQAPFVELSMKGTPIKFLNGADTCEGKDGWRWTSEAGTFSSLELCGAACESLKVEAALDVVVGCEPPA